MSQDSLENFKAYRLAMELFDLVIEDLTPLTRNPALQKLVSQQLGSADSIAANIEEGHGRETTKEYIRFLVIARGSARETKGRYQRMRKWFPEEIVADRTERCSHIFAILTKTIISLKRRGSSQ
ncbi:four helix bundle protein [Puniceicoccus vermicola]|uniref:Four helix bundle protein n=1 Tax=Puniceicoccus vermicola TaxID=388746 RepID=A0A7X1B1D3_9BACT|nr:four helix bundle protein [Puniceicoccus vermicola]MBC2603836.1 four helix bundle protein [Puniceicoccus vermicola]